MSNAPSRPMLWTGRILSAIPALMMIVSAAMKFKSPPQVLEMFTGKFGFPESTLLAIGVLEVACAVLYLIPQTSILGAILLAGYLGGAIATHVRVHDAYLIPLGLGVLAWLGLYLREPRLRALVPFRRPPN